MTLTVILVQFLFLKCESGVSNIASSYKKEFAKAEPNDITLFSVSADLFVEQKEAPVNKYFFTPNFSYSQNPEMWNELYHMIENKIPDNIYIPFYCGDELIVSRYYIGNNKINTEKVKEILLSLKENYICEKEYENHLYKWTRKVPE